MLLQTTLPIITASPHCHKHSLLNFSCALMLLFDNVQKPGFSVNSLFRNRHADTQKAGIKRSAKPNRGNQTRNPISSRSTHPVQETAPKSTSLI